MADGRLNKCKECTKNDVALNYRDKRAYYSKYDQERYKTDSRRKMQTEYQKIRRLRYPQKYLAWRTVSNSLRSGKLIKPDICSKCGSGKKIQAHHEDYSKPLDIIWLCFKCHRELEHQQTVTVID
jgi:ribosomal protein S27AE